MGLARARAGLALLALLGAGTGSAVLAGPAGADTTATVTFTSPATDGMTMTSPATLSGTAQQPQGYVDSIDITVRWTDTVNRPPAPHPTQETTLTPPTHGPDASWSFTPQPAANGRYTVTVVATTQTPSSPSSQTTASRSFVLDVNPAVPTGVKVTTDTSQRTAHITWAANTEPDMVGYEVLRAGPAATDTAKVIAGVDVPQTDYTDTDVATQPPGTYRYSIVAVRQSGDGTKPDLSAPSAEADATFTTPAKSQPPPPPTTSAPTKPPPTASASAPPSSGAPNVVIAAPARAPLSDYQRLLRQAVASTATTEAPDPGFSTNLPYQPKTTHEVVQLPGVALESGTLGAVDRSQGVRRTAEFVAGALMLAVLALFGLVLKRAAEQPLALEALAPESAAASPVPGPPVPGPAGLGPSLMLTIVKPSNPDPLPAEQLAR